MFELFEGSFYMQHMIGKSLTKARSIIRSIMSHVMRVSRYISEVDQMLIKS